MQADELWPGDPGRRSRWEQLMALLRPQPGESILDVGCGRGAAVGFIAERVGPAGCAVGLERLPDRLATASTSFV